VNEQVGLLEDMVPAGGCAKNESLARALEQRLKVKVKMKALPMNPPIAGAVEAALIVIEKVAPKTQTDSVAAESATWSERGGRFLNRPFAY
jgi:activator of 2-hydroxyglutaryl-CoA dehydratase